MDAIRCLALGLVVATSGCSLSKVQLDHYFSPSAESGEFGFPSEEQWEYWERTSEPEFPDRVRFEGPGLALSLHVPDARSRCTPLVGPHVFFMVPIPVIPMPAFLKKMGSCLTGSEELTVRIEIQLILEELQREVQVRFREIQLVDLEHHRAYRPTRITPSGGEIVDDTWNVGLGVPGTGTAAAMLVYAFRPVDELGHAPEAVEEPTDAPRVPTSFRLRLEGFSSGGEQVHFPTLEFSWISDWSLWYLID